MHAVFVSLDRASQYLRKRLEAQSNLNTLFPIEISKNNFLMSKCFIINPVDIMGFKGRYVQKIASAILEPVFCVNPNVDYRKYCTLRF